MDLYIATRPSGYPVSNTAMSLHDLRRIGGDRTRLIENPIALPVYNRREIEAIAQKHDTLGYSPIVLPWEWIRAIPQGGRGKSHYPKGMEIATLRVPRGVVVPVQQYAIYLANGGQIDQIDC